MPTVRDDVRALREKARRQPNGIASLELRVRALERLCEGLEDLEQLELGTTESDAAGGSAVDDGEVSPAATAQDGSAPAAPVSEPAATREAQQADRRIDPGTTPAPTPKRPQGTHRGHMKHDK